MTILELASRERSPRVRSPRVHSPRVHSRQEVRSQTRGKVTDRIVWMQQYIYLTPTSERTCQLSRSCHLQSICVHAWVSKELGQWTLVCAIRDFTIGIPRLLCTHNIDVTVRSWRGRLNNHKFKFSSCYMFLHDKQYFSRNMTGRWSKEEHEGFMTGLGEHGRNWAIISKKYVLTRTAIQVRTHAQKYFKSLDAGVQFPLKVRYLCNLVFLFHFHSSGVSSNRFVGDVCVSSHLGWRHSPSLKGWSCATHCDSYRAYIFSVYFLDN